jgi:hypothetical protein
VIGASGALTGHAGGLDVKRRLFAHERGASAAAAERGLPFPPRPLARTA